MARLLAWIVMLGFGRRALMYRPCTVPAVLFGEANGLRWGCWHAKTTCKATRLSCLICSMFPNRCTMQRRRVQFTVALATGQNFADGQNRAASGSNNHQNVDLRLNWPLETRALSLSISLPDRRPLHRLALAIITGELFLAARNNFFPFRIASAAKGWRHKHH